MFSSCGWGFVHFSEGLLRYRHRPVFKSMIIIISVSNLVSPVRALGGKMYGHFSHSKCAASCKRPITMFRAHLLFSVPLFKIILKLTWFPFDRKCWRVYFCLVYLSIRLIETLLWPLVRGVLTHYIELVGRGVHQHRAHRGYLWLGPCSNQTSKPLINGGWIHDAGYDFS